MEKRHKIGFSLLLLAAAFLAPKAEACGGGQAMRTIIPMLVLMNWLPVVGSMVITVPISVWREMRAKKNSLNMLREGACIKELQGAQWRRRLITVAAVLTAAVISPFLLGRLIELGFKTHPVFTSRVYGVYWQVAMTPEQLLYQFTDPAPPILY